MVSIRNSMVDEESVLHELKKEKSTIERIIEWNERAEEEEDKIDQFIFRWISFSGLYSSLYDAIFGEEKAVKVRDIDVMSKFSKEFIENNYNLAHQIYSIEIETFLNKNIRERSGLTGKFMDFLENEKEIQKKAKAMVLISYIIRCRLFHGKKSPVIEVNQDVAKVADQIIRPIIIYFLEKIQKE